MICSKNITNFKGIILDRTIMESYKDAAIRIVNSLKKKDFPVVGNVINSNLTINIRNNTTYFLEDKFIAFGYKDRIAVNIDLKSTSRIAIKLRNNIVDYCYENNYKLHYVDEIQFKELFDSIKKSSENSYNKEYQKELIANFSNYLEKDIYFVDNKMEIVKNLLNEF